jgi:hypothetical protein
VTEGEGITLIGSDSALMAVSFLKPSFERSLMTLRLYLRTRTEREGERGRKREKQTEGRTKIGR